jgi:regulator of RNase E activity RraB
MNWRKLLFWRKPRVVVVATYDPKERREGDLRIIEQIARDGADMSQPREVVHFFFMPTAEAAHRATDSLLMEGYRIEVAKTADSDRNTVNPWMALVRNEAIVSIDAVDSFYERFTALARSFGGQYSGWEADGRP